MSGMTMPRRGRRLLVLAPVAAVLLAAAFVPWAAAEDVVDDPESISTETETPTADPTDTETVSPEPTVSPSPTVDDTPTEPLDDATGTVDETTGTVEDTLAEDEPTTAPTEEPTGQDGDEETTDDGDTDDGTTDGNSDDGNTTDPAAPGTTDGDGGTDAGRGHGDASPGSQPSDDGRDLLPALPPLPTVSSQLSPLAGPSGPRSTDDIIDALEAIGAPPEEMARVLAPFPVIGRAHYSNDWHAARTTPSFHLHEGVDVFAARGTPVVAIADGRIDRIRLGTAVGGNTVWLAADDGTEYFYAHLDRVADGLRVGQRVTRATVLGHVGNTGNAATTPPHLHLQVHPEGGAPVPPVPLLDQWLAEAREELGLEGPEATSVAVSMPPARPVGGELALSAPQVAPPLRAWDTGASGLGAMSGATPGTDTSSGIAAATTRLAASATAPSGRGSLWSLGITLLAVGLWSVRSRRTRRPAQPGFLRDDTFRRPFATSAGGALARHAHGPGTC